MNLLEQLQRTRVFFFDIDGVLTDGTVLLLEHGLQARTMHVRDGLALQMALRNGYRVVIVSGAHSDPVAQRMAYLGLTEVFTAIKDKASFFRDFIQKEGIQKDVTLFMGDDLPDIALLQIAGVATCPADAAPEVKSICHFISTFNGGKGCVREVIEKVLKLNGHWQPHTDLTSR